VFIGDSITQGIGEDDGYVNILKKRFKKEKIRARLINRGKSNTKTEKCIEILRESIKEDAPHIVVIACGIVDAIYLIPPFQLKQHLTILVEESLNRQIKVILGQIDLSCWRIGHYGNRFNQIYEDLPQKYDLLTFPFLNNQTLANKKYNIGDFIHPNQAGAQVIADFLYPIIVESMEEIRL
jgi:lysophospholipase L1-like esterase